MSLNLYLPIFKIVEDLVDDLPDDESKLFIAAINAAAVGKDLSVAHWKFLATELRALPDDLPKHIQALVDQVIAGMDRLAAGEEWSSYEVTRISSAISAPGASGAALNLACCAADAAYYASGATVYSSACATAESAAEAARAAGDAYDDVANYTVGIRRVSSRLLKFIENA